MSETDKPDHEGYAVYIDLAGKLPPARVPADVFDQVIAERDALKADLAQVAMDRDALVCEVASLKAQLQMAEAGVAALKKHAGASETS